MLTFALLLVLSTMQVSSSHVSSAETRFGDGWKDIPGAGLSVISTGHAGVWGIDGNNGVYAREGTYNYGTLSETPDAGEEWKRIEGSLQDISVGYNIVWGTTPDLHVMVRRGIDSFNPYGTHWERESGSLKRITVNSRTNQVWGLYSYGFIFFRTGVPEPTRDTDHTGNGWSFVPGRLRFISASDAGVWGLDPTGNVIFRRGITENNKVGTHWELVPSKNFKQIQGGHNVVWGVDHQNQVFVRQGISEINPTGTQWTNIPGSFQYVAANTLDGSVWAIKDSNSVSFRENARLVNEGYSPWTNYGACNEKYGYRYRLRYCIDQTNVNVSCNQTNLIEFKSCEMKFCETTPLYEDLTQGYQY